MYWLSCIFVWFIFKCLIYIFTSVCMVGWNDRNAWMFFVHNSYETMFSVESCMVRSCGNLLWSSNRHKATDSFISSSESYYNVSQRSRAPLYGKSIKYGMEHETDWDLPFRFSTMICVTTICQSINACQ